MSDISADDELASLGEFIFLEENARQAGVHTLPAVERIESGPISALRWGDGPPRVLFLHGGGQNAHTWDTVIVGLGEPALAIDLPGHGCSAWRDDGDTGRGSTPWQSSRWSASSRRTPIFSSGCRWVV